MALREDIVEIQRKSKDATTALADPSRDVAGETKITVLPAQRLELLTTFRTLLTDIMAAAARIKVP